ncbi:MAG: glycosyltransferase [Pseudomonadota bacterium]
MISDFEDHFRAGETLGLLSESWMRATYPEIAGLGLTDIMVSPNRFHCATSPAFDPVAYTETYADVSGFAQHPFIHFMRHGRDEGREPLPLFDLEALAAGVPFDSRLWIESHDLSLTGAPMALMSFLEGSETLRQHGVLAAPHVGPLRSRAEALGLPLLLHAQSFRRATGLERYDTLVARMMRLLKATNITSVLANSVASFPTVAAGLELGLPVSWIIHEPDPEEMQAMVPQEIWESVLPKLREVDRLTFVSEQSRAAWMGAETVAGVNVVPKAIPKRHAPDRSAGRKAARCGPGDLMVLSVGTFSPRKGQADLVSALEAIAEDEAVSALVIMMVGFVPSPFGEALMDRISTLRNCGIRIIVQPQSKTSEERESVEALFAAADVFVMSSHAEARPLTTSEALAAGTPVISTDAPGIAELVSDGQTGALYPTGNATALAALLMRYLENRALLKYMRRQIVAQEDPGHHGRMVRDLEQSVLPDTHSSNA